MQELEWIDVGDGESAVKRRRRVDGSRDGRKSGARQSEDRGIEYGGCRRKIEEEQIENRRREMTPEERTESRRRRMASEERSGSRRRRLTPEERLARKRRRRRAQMIRMMILAAIVMLVIGLGVGAVKLVGYIYHMVTGEAEVPAVANLEQELIEPVDTRRWKEFYETPLETPQLSVQLLTVNEFSRPGETLPEVKNIFIHYTANAGTTAEQNRSYFESLAETKERSASAHFVIGYDGVIVQCIPTKEIAYAVQTRNYDSISIECCYVDESGIFTQQTYDSLIELTAWLLHKYELEPEDVLRHYDSNGKLCPKYYVEHEDAWQQFLMDLENYMEKITVQSVENNSVQSL